MTTKLTPARKAFLVKVAPGLYQNEVEKSPLYSKLLEEGFIRTDDVGQEDNWVGLTPLGFEAAGLTPTPVEAELAAEDEPAKKETAKEMRLRIEAEATAAIEADRLAADAAAEAGTPAEEPEEADVAPATRPAKAKTTKGKATKADPNDYPAVNDEEELLGTKAPAKAKAPAKKVAEKPAAKAPAKGKAKAAKTTAEAPTVGLKWYGKVRETKTMVSIADGAAVDNVEGGRWLVACHDHGVLVHFDNLSVAHKDAGHPLQWCNGCKAAASDVL